jgi:Domain of unknown function (DUF4145)
MAELVANCPRCGSQKITFDVKAANIIAQSYGWQNMYEAFCSCRHCLRACIFVLTEKADGSYEYVHKTGLLKLGGAINGYVDIRHYVSLKDESSVAPPDYLPKEIETVFREAATCLAVGCYNAAGTMFRLCVDLATRSMLPEGNVPGLNEKTRRDLGLRIPWLLKAGLLPQALEELSSCIKEDGNDGAHAGTLAKAEAEDLLDFTSALLERLYTEKERLRLAKERRESRRSSPDAHG